MVDLTQLVLFGVIIVLTILLLVIGTQVFLLIRDLRKTIKKVDLITQEATEVSSKIKGAIDTILEVRLGLKTFSNIVAFLKEKTKNGEEHEHISEK
jgi:hypothetical protein